MGKIRKFEIVFNETRTAFHPGETLCGQVHIELESPMKMKAVTLKINGRAKVRWKEEKGSGDSKVTVTYTDTQNLFNYDGVLEGKGADSDKDKNILAEGEHTYSFEYQLPGILPSSFEGHTGYIRYYVKSTIDTPTNDHDAKKAFTVVDILDLNERPDMLIPSGISKSKTLCCWCCRSGLIELDFHVDRTGYVPGEWINISGTVINGSNSKIKKTSAKILQLIKYHAEGKTIDASDIVGKVSGPGCGSKGTITWTNKRIQIPPVPPTETNHCRVIDIIYVVRFDVRLRSCAGDLRARAPIIIGTVPLKTLSIYSQQAAEASASDTMSYSVPPPSYAAAISGAVDIKENDDNVDIEKITFTPQYTYYDWNESAFAFGADDHQ